jgi:hypothetical protein
MAAPNFSKRNASRYFCIGRNRYFTQEDIDELELSQDMLGQFDQYGTQESYDWTKSILMDELKKVGYWEPDATSRWSYDRLNYEGSYGSVYLAKTRIDFQYAGAEFYIDIRVKENIGHYSGSCLDYEISVSGCNFEEGDFDLCDDYNDDFFFDVEDLIEKNVCGNLGMTKLQAKNIIKKLYHTISKAKDELELIFSRCCDDELYLDWICDYGCGIVGEAGYDSYPTRLYEEREAA